MIGSGHAGGKSKLRVSINRSLLLFVFLMVGFVVPNSFPKVCFAKHVGSNSGVAAWKLEIDGPIFPSILLSTAFLKIKNPQILGDPHSSIRVKVTPRMANARIHVTAQVDGLSAPSIYDGTLGEAKTTYVIAPAIRWDSQKLLALRQPIPVTISVSIALNGISLGSKTQSVEVRAVNDVPFATADSTGKEKDLSPLFAAFVNENNPVVEQILRKALYYRAVNSFDGYQRSVKDVEMQVFSIWNVLQRHHVKYSNIATPSGFSNKIYSQTVRFIDETWRMQQANCVDGSVLFASVLYKIGLYPMLVKLPGHMFVGYYLNPKNYGKLKGMQFIETTLIGSGKQPGEFNMKFGRFLHPARASLSYKQFVNAITYGNHEFTSKVLPALQRHAPGYDIIDIRRARALGIAPISD